MEESIMLIVINNNVKDKDGIIDCMFASPDKDNIKEIQITNEGVDKLLQYPASDDIDKMYHFRYVYEYMKKNNPLEFNMLNLDHLNINYDESNFPLVTKLCQILAHNGNIVIINSGLFAIVKAPMDYITLKQYESLKSLEKVFVNKDTCLDSVKIQNGKVKINKFRDKFDIVVEEYALSLKNGVNIKRSK